MFGNKVVEIKKSKFNGEIKVVKTLGIGTYFQVGGITQSGGVVGQLWKSALKKIPLKEIENCLILGLGGGSVAGLIRKKYPSAKITGVEIDPVMVSLGRKYLGLGNGHVEIIIQDALKYKTGQKFDLVVIDLYKGQTFPKQFETKEFLQKIHSVLSKNGVAVLNRLNNVDEGFEKKLKKVFKSVKVVKPLINTIFICKK